MKVLQVRVKPNARASVLLPPAAEGEPWQAQLAAPPVDGRANDELVRLVARHFGCSRSAVRIKSGAGARLKLVQVAQD
ncbi:DUF167 domain-containing protein [Ramlibacter rhizophilus]|uniref:UPF0235 protein EZ242_20510 n=1 Tax=Ramlibacter rhizophilus TaxID=1781167 RepID=A0A4Z0BBD3_9BURK|nr:DUF167 domain-containing protein [Ramlibacter rhizophilus]TFY96432.1 DUF167 domain-containing protein [Ramlibacter rhizophilus]